MSVRCTATDSGASPCRGFPVAFPWPPRVWPLTPGCRRPLVHRPLSGKPAPVRTGNRRRKVPAKCKLAGLNNLTKHVASRMLAEPLPWANSVLLPPDAAAAVAELKSQVGPDPLVMGGGNLLRSLIAEGLVAEYTLLIHPLTRGNGGRFFDRGLPATDLELVETLDTTTGVIIAVYRPANR